MPQANRNFTQLCKRPSSLCMVCKHYWREHKPALERLQVEQSYETNVVRCLLNVFLKAVSRYTPKNRSTNSEKTSVLLSYKGNNGSSFLFQ